MNTRAGKTKGLLTNIRGRLGGPHSTRWGGTGRLRKLVPALPWIALAALALLALAAVTLLPPLISPDLDDPHAQFEVRDRARLTVAAIIGGVVVLVGVYINWRRVSALERQVTTLQLGQITERFTRAIDQLGTVRTDNEPAREIRAGGVRSLERIARESAEDFWPVLDILTAYLRSESPTASPDVEALGAEEIFEIDAHEIRNRMDVAFTVDAIQRLWPFERQPVPEPLNLAFTFAPQLSLPEKNLEGADLRYAYLRGANLRGADLRGAKFEGANLEEANLAQANLKQANLEGARLDRASLEQAHLEQANLSRASFRHADLAGADLRIVDLRYAHLEGAILMHANLDDALLDGATHDKRTHWPKGFTPPAAAE